MKKYPKLKIEIQGHICCQPVKDIGNISTARAITVYNYLIDNGIGSERLSYKAFGNKYPIYPIPEKTESERIANRRVEIEIIQN